MREKFLFGRVRRELRDKISLTANSLKDCYEFSNSDSEKKVLSIDSPSPRSIIKAHKILIDVMLPGRIKEGPEKKEDIEFFLKDSLLKVVSLLGPEIEKAIPFIWSSKSAIDEGAKKEEEDIKLKVDSILSSFLDSLFSIREFVKEDIKAAYEGDPAALSYAEVQLSYPGVLAIVSHRIAHSFYSLGVPLIPRIMSEWAHKETGVDINPGAKIGKSFFIDHASGVVIGETTEIGDRVKIYQGVTLGAKSFALDKDGKPIKHIKRHPTVKDDVVIYSNSTVLGGDTVIGKGSVIGANVFLMESVKENTVIISSSLEHLVKRLTK